MKWITWEHVGVDRMACYLRSFRCRCHSTQQEGEPCNEMDYA